MVGETAPDFTLKDQNGKEFRLYDNLSNNVMLVFYPKDETLVCTKQLCSYNNEYEEFMRAGIQIVGVNMGDEESHKKFVDKNNFRFPLLADKNKEVSKIYNAVSITGLNKRKIIVIDKSRKVIYESSTLPIFYKGTSVILDKIKSLK